MTAVEKKLQQMLNRDFLYGMRNITITGYEVNEERGRIYIHTNEQMNHFDRPVDDCASFLETLKPFEKREVATISQADALMETVVSADYLERVLKDNIEKVQKDAGYIKQATAINNNVNSLININKMKLDYAKAASRMK